MRRLRSLWKIVTQIMGEDAYARYCDHMRRKHPGHSPSPPREFYKMLLEERYSRPSRCC